MSEEIIDLTQALPAILADLPIYRYAMVDPAGLVVGVIMWNGEDQYKPEENVTLHKLEEGSPVSPGWALRDGEWVDERPEPWEPK